MEFFKPPEALSLHGNLRDNWRRWVQRFDLCLKASGKIKEKEDVQCGILLYVIGEEAMGLYNTFQFATEEDRTKLDVLKSKFEEYVNPRKNTVFERCLLWEYKQQEGETINQFITELKTSAKCCEFGDQHDSMIRDRIVFGVSDTRLKERLLRESSDLTLEKAASLCRAAETSKNQLKELHSSKTKPVHVIKPKSKQKPSKKPRQQQAFNCKKCVTKHLPKACPAFRRLCLFCKEKNNYAKMCPQKNPPVNMVDSSEHASSGGQVESEELFIGTLTGPRSAENSAWFSNLLVGGTTVTFKLDTGAEANVLPISVYSKPKNKSSLLETSVFLSSYG